MGCVCSCFHVPDPEENLNTSSSGSFCCPCGFFHTVINKYKSLYSNNQIRNLPLRDEGPVSLTSIVPSDIPQSQTTTSVPRTLSFNVNSSHSNLQQDSLVTINERGAAPLHLNRQSHSQQLRNSDHSTQKLVNSSLKLSFNKTKPGYVHESFEDEDACPTCLEEYTPENPRIVTKCFHHYHLSCIYEWMERSPTCPVCSKVMAFDEIV